MGIMKEIVSTLKGDAEVREIRTCVFWTAVVSRHCGLASTPRECPGHGEKAPVRDLEAFDRMGALELANLSLSEDPIEASIGVAAVNSLIEVDKGRCVEANASELLLNKGVGKRVAVVGSFPFVPKVRKAAKELWMFERMKIEGALPESEAERLLPQADVIAISGSALVNGSMDRLLGLCPPEAFTMVLGPSTPLSEVFFEHGVDVVCGTQVTDADQVLWDISRGACFRQVRGTRLVTMARSGLAQGGAA